jgi:cyanate permease
MSVQQIGLSIVPNVVGYIKDKSGNYDDVMLFFVAINGLGLMINLALYFVDIQQMDGILNKVAHDD